MIPTLPSALSPSGPHPSLSPLSHPASTLTVHLHHERPPHSRQAKNGELRRQLRRTESTAAAGFVKDVVLKFLLAGDEARPRCTGDARGMHGRCTGDGRGMNAGDGRCTGDAREIHTHARRTSYLVQCTLHEHVVCMCSACALTMHGRRTRRTSSSSRRSCSSPRARSRRCTPHARRMLTAHMCSARARVLCKCSHEHLHECSAREHLYVSTCT